MTNEEYIEAFRQWGIDRKIIGNGTFEGQWLKLISEIGELADSLAKGKSPIDDIGDCFVVLVMMEAIAGVTDWGCMKAVQRDERKKTSPIDILQTLLFSVCFLSEGIPSLYHNAMHLNRIANACGLTVNKCLAHAWNEIKDRKGYLNENGVFIKEDTNNVQA